jgi:hypothetical protein
VLSKGVLGQAVRLENGDIGGGNCGEMGAHG